MKMRKLIVAVPLLAAFAFLAFYGFIFFQVYKFNQAAAVPLYEVGDYSEAKLCQECHEEIYDQWQQNSAHAEANNNPRFFSFKDKVTGNFLTNIVIGDANCYACMGPRETVEGVSCEICHGLPIPDVDIMVSHEQKFIPGLEDLKKPEFCAKCHQFPETGEGMSLYSEWQESEAAKQGLTCHDCHMKKKDGLAYHGFDSLSRLRDAERYANDLDIRDFDLSFPKFNLVIENLLISHALPPSGPSRILVLEISFLDTAGSEIHRIVQPFKKQFNLLPLVGIHPFMLLENTQLQSGEVRQLSFTLPSSLEGLIDRAALTLKFYDVSDEYTGDLSKAHWVSEPFITEEVRF